MTGAGDVADLEPVGHHPGQGGSHDRADTDKETLHRETQGALIFRQVIADERPERLHRDIDARIHDPQHAGRHPQVGRVRHHEKRQGCQDGAEQEKRPPAAQAIPGAVAHVSDDRLHDQAGDRGRNPQDGQILDFRTQRLEDPADVGILQGEAKLDAEESKTHVPDLPEVELRFLFH